MAAAVHNLMQQKGAVEGRLKMLLNTDLKQMCKSYGLIVSGTKIQMQKRLQEVLDRIVTTGDVSGFDLFRYRIANHGMSPAQTSTSHQSVSHRAHPHNKPAAYSMGAAGSRPSGATQASNRNGVHFKSSPFFEILDTVLSMQDLPEMPQNRNTVKAQLVLTDDTVRKLKADKDLRILICCGQTTLMNNTGTAEIMFPNQIEVRINGDEVKHNFKGLRNKPGTTKPVDVTRMVRLSPGYPSQISLTYALTTKRLAYIAYLARYISSEKLVQQIQSGKVIAKQTVLDEMRKANEDPDIAATSIRMSLKDPISTMRIDLPVRSTICKHVQCFDGAMFLQLQEQAPQWLCPICNKLIPFRYLCIDKYFEDILKSTSKSIEKVSVEPDGSWTIIKDEDDSQVNGSSHKPRASYDDDFDDDDAIEVIDDVSPQSNHVHKPSLIPPKMMTPFSHLSMNTPPGSSREASVAQSTSSLATQSHKRPASTVIDLTLSDDEDEAPRPAKRVANSSASQSMASFSASGNGSNAYASYTNSTFLPSRSDFRGTENVDSHTLAMSRNRQPSFSGRSSYHSPQSPLMVYPPPAHSRPLVSQNPTPPPPQPSSLQNGMKLPPLQGNNSYPNDWRRNDYNFPNRPR